ncbi:MAG: class I SAM-dependent methyltransferase [Solirubrobacteraceae bacterium]|nr:class I SAM-dependent methyltransferase [Solirubrobacteraceae bacterium]
MPRRRLIPRNPGKAVLDAVGLTVGRVPSPERIATTHPDLGGDEQFVRITERVWPYTMTSIERLWALYEAVRYVRGSGIEGAFVECGVWRGGSSMLSALTLQAESAADRELYLYDTFEGMSDPTEHDAGRHEPDLADEWDRFKGDTAHPVFAHASLDDVRANMAATGYDADRIHYVQGKVEDTIPATLPGSIALLRLDTDWYESTKHELEHLYPLLAPGGVLIIDDYGYWAGARRAVDEWLETLPSPLLLTRVDDTARLALKPFA